MVQRNPVASINQYAALQGTDALKVMAPAAADSASWEQFFTENGTSTAHFLAIARCGSFNQAARRFGLRVDLVRKGITRLEQRLGMPLFVKKNSVLELTPPGKHLFQLVNKVPAAGGQHAGMPAITPIRLSIPPMLLDGTLFRSLISWLRKNSGAYVVLQNPDNSNSPPADVRMWFGGPESSSLPAAVVLEPQRISWLHYLPYIAGSYASKRIIPSEMSDLEDYMLVHYTGYRQIAGLAPWNEIIDQRRHGVMQVQSYDMLRELVRWSGCIGLLTENAGSQGRNFMPLNGVFREAMMAEVWIGINPASPYLAEARRIMAMMVQACADDS